MAVVVVGPTTVFMTMDEAFMLLRDAKSLTREEHTDIRGMMYEAEYRLTFKDGQAVSMRVKRDERFEFDVFEHIVSLRTRLGEVTDV